MKPDSWFADVMGDNMVGQCLHHQGLGTIGKNLEVCIVDDYNNQPHGLELKNSNRWVKAVLWHPELTHTDEMGN